MNQFDRGMLTGAAILLFAEAVSIFGTAILARIMKMVRKIKRKRHMRTRK